MCSVCRPIVTLALGAALIASAGAATSASRHPLRVCADPNNLPFSNKRGQGFENAIARVVARDLGRTVEYYWQPQRRAFLRTTLQAGYCDVVMSVPSTLERVRPTRPYYRSSYVFVTRRDRGLDIRSFDDPRLRDLRIGIQVTGDDYENPPPALALASRRLVDHLRGYTVYGDYSREDPQRAIVDAVASGDVDVAVVWGPLAGFFAKREAVPLALVSVAAVRNDPAFAFDIAAAVRRDDVGLHDAIDAALGRNAGEIRAILKQFGVPR